MTKVSLGLIETWGYIPAIEAADAGTKAADVTMLGYEVTLTGLITVKFVGDVAAVKASVAAAKIAAGKVGKVVATHVIPRPDLQLRANFPDRPVTEEEQYPVQKSPPPTKSKAAQAKSRKGPAKKKASKPSRGKASLLKKTANDKKTSTSTAEVKTGKERSEDAVPSKKKGSKVDKPKTNKKQKQSRSE